METATHRRSSFVYPTGFKNRNLWCQQLFRSSGPADGVGGAARFPSKQKAACVMKRAATEERLEMRKYACAAVQQGLWWWGGRWGWWVGGGGVPRCWRQTRASKHAPAGRRVGEQN